MAGRPSPPAIDRVALVPVGDRPYGPDELADATNGAEVAVCSHGTERGLARLLDRGVSGGWHRTPLARSARDVLQHFGFAFANPTTSQHGDAEDCRGERRATSEAARA